MIKEERINILLSSDDNYARHMGVVIYSVLTTNTDVAAIRFFIVNNGISQENKEKITEMVQPFSNAEVNYIDFGPWEKHLQLNMLWNISMSSYGRLFVGEMLPKDVNRILYLDCDMLVCDSLCELWRTEMGNNVIGAVMDYVPFQTKKGVGLSNDELYFNAGMLLINLDLWRKFNIGKVCLDFINKRHGNVLHHDQGTLNGVLKKRWFKLPLKYNVMTINYVLPDRQHHKRAKEKNYFSEEEVLSAKSSPVILHFTPSYTTRPWVSGCVHPLKHLYWNTLRLTPWANSTPEKDTRRLLLRWYEFLLRIKLHLL